MNKNNIYYKTHSNILSYLKLNEVKNGNKIFSNKLRSSENDSISNTINDYLSKYNYKTINNNHMNYNNDIIFPNSIRLKFWNNNLFSKTINYHEKDIPRHNNKFLSFRIGPHMPSHISEEKNERNQIPSPRGAYRKVGNVLSRKECQFTKNKSIYNNTSINKSVKKSKSEIYYKKYAINRKKKYNKHVNIKVNLNTRKIMKLERPIELSEDKLIMRENKLDKILKSPNQIEEQKCPVPIQQIKKIGYPMTELIQNKENFFTFNNYNNTSVLSKMKSNLKEELCDYLEEPLEQIAPNPYLLQKMNIF
jgi:hypothetical protein